MLIGETLSNMPLPRNDTLLERNLARRAITEIVRAATVEAVQQFASKAQICLITPAILLATNETFIRNLALGLGVIAQTSFCDQSQRPGNNDLALVLARQPRTHSELA